VIESVYKSKEFAAFRERRIRERKQIKTIKVQTAALTTALRELGVDHKGTKERTAAIKQIREALERVTG